MRGVLCPSATVQDASPLVALAVILLSEITIFSEYVPVVGQFGFSTDAIEASKMFGAFRRRTIVAVAVHLDDVLAAASLMRKAVVTDHTPVSGGHAQDVFTAAFVVQFIAEEHVSCYRTVKPVAPGGTRDGATDRVSNGDLIVNRVPGACRVSVSIPEVRARGAEHIVLHAIVHIHPQHRYLLDAPTALSVAYAGRLATVPCTSEFKVHETPIADTRCR